MNKKMLSVVLVLGGVVILAITLYGYDKSKRSQAEQEALQNALLATVPKSSSYPVDKIYISSDACKLTEGIAAKGICNGVETSYAEDANTCLQEAIDKLSQIPGKSMQGSQAEQRKALACQILGAFPEKSETLEEDSLEASLYYLLNIHLNK